jgi:FtsH-binding integral membrane protein
MLMLLRKQIDTRRKRMMMVYKMLVVGVVALISVLLYKKNPTGAANRWTKHSTDVVAVHRKLGWYILLATVALVLLIEKGVRMKGGSQKNAWFWVHIVAAIVYFLSVLMLVLFYHGDRPFHKYVAYIAMASFAVLACIGIPMLFKRF